MTTAITTDNTAAPAPAPTFNEVRSAINSAIKQVKADHGKPGGNVHISFPGLHLTLTAFTDGGRKVFGTRPLRFAFYHLDPATDYRDILDPRSHKTGDMAGIVSNHQDNIRNWMMKAVLDHFGIPYHERYNRSKPDSIAPGPRPERPPVPDALPPVAAIIDSKDTPPADTTAYQDTRSRQTGVPVEQLEKEMQEAEAGADPDYHDPIGRLARYMDGRREAGLDSRELAEELLTAMGLAKGGPMHLVNLLDKGIRAEEAVTDYNA